MNQPSKMRQTQHQLQQQKQQQNQFPAINAEVQQALQLLQLTKSELKEKVVQELKANSLLDEVEVVETSTQLSDAHARGSQTFKPPGHRTEYTRPAIRSKKPTGKSASFDQRLIEAVPDATLSLGEHLYRQVCLERWPPKLVQVAKALIGNIDEGGYLDASDEEILDSLDKLADDDCNVALHAPYSVLDVKRACRRLSKLDPVGIGTRTMQERLLIQLEERSLGKSLAAYLLRNYIKLLARHEYDELARLLKCCSQDVRNAVATIRDLSPRLGGSFGYNSGRPIIPDVHVEKVGDDFEVLLNDEGVPKLRIWPGYEKLLSTVDNESQRALLNKYRSGQQFIRNLDFRDRTLLEVAKAIVARQWEFLEKGIGALKPLTQVDVANDIGVVESTISRAVKHKYIATPQGTFEMSWFFSGNARLKQSNGTELPAEAAKVKIRRLIDDEDTANPLSDPKLSSALRSVGIQISTRTVTKYRVALGVPDFNVRRKLAK
jgi:RNA polymerase sigma-54 factor